MYSAPCYNCNSAQRCIKWKHRCRYSILTSRSSATEPRRPFNFSGLSIEDSDRPRRWPFLPSSLGGFGSSTDCAGASAAAAVGAAGPAAKGEGHWPAFCWAGATAHHRQQRQQHGVAS